MAAHDQKRQVSGESEVHAEKRARWEADRIAAALRQVYGRISAEPLPRRFLELVKHLKLRH
ncbi:MAG: hypothetical protein KGL11_11315 [Alphaproteobacteria bacterium]|nr:hypothetical protein [Alphaproteobacteria bacterium]